MPVISHQPDVEVVYTSSLSNYLQSLVERRIHELSSPSGDIQSPLLSGRLHDYIKLDSIKESMDSLNTLADAAQVAYDYLRANPQVRIDRDTTKASVRGSLMESAPNYPHLNFNNPDLVEIILAMILEPEASASGSWHLDIDVTSVGESRSFKLAKLYASLLDSYTPPFSLSETKQSKKYRMDSTGKGSTTQVYPTAEGKRLKIQDLYENPYFKEALVSRVNTAAKDEEFKPDGFLADATEAYVTLNSLALLRYLDHLTVLLFDPSAWVNFLSARLGSVDPSANASRANSLEVLYVYLHGLLRIQPVVIHKFIKESFPFIQERITGSPLISGTLIENYESIISEMDVMHSAAYAESLLVAMDSKAATNGLNKDVKCIPDELSKLYTVSTHSTTKIEPVRISTTMRLSDELKGNKPWQEVMLASPVGEISLLPDHLANAALSIEAKITYQAGVDALQPYVLVFRKDAGSATNVVRLMNPTIPFGYDMDPVLSVLHTDVSPIITPANTLPVTKGCNVDCWEFKDEMEEHLNYSMFTVSAQRERRPIKFFIDQGAAEAAYADKYELTDTYMPSIWVGGPESANTHSLDDPRTFENMFGALTPKGFRGITYALNVARVRSLMATPLSSFAFLLVVKQGIKVEDATTFKDYEVILGVGHPYGMEMKDFFDLQGFKPESKVFKFPKGINADLALIMITKVPLPKALLPFEADSIPWEWDNSFVPNKWTLRWKPSSTEFLVLPENFSLTKVHAMAHFSIRPTLISDLLLPDILYSRDHAFRNDLAFLELGVNITPTQRMRRHQKVGHIAPWLGVRHHVGLEWRNFGTYLPGGTAVAGPGGATAGATTDYTKAMEEELAKKALAEAKVTGAAKEPSAAISKETAGITQVATGQANGKGGSSTAVGSSRKRDRNKKGKAKEVKDASDDAGNKDAKKEGLSQTDEDKALLAGKKDASASTASILDALTGKK